MPLDTPIKYTATPITPNGVSRHLASPKITINQEVSSEISFKYAGVQIF